MEKTTQMGILITAFFIIIIGIALIQTIGDQNYNTQNTRTVKQLYTVSNTSCAVLASGHCVASITSVTNATYTAPEGNYSKCSSTGSADYNGVLFKFTGTNYSNGGSVNVTYEQSINCQYVSDSVSRNLMNLNTLWIALAILMVGVAIFIKVKEDYF